MPGTNQQQDKLHGITLLKVLLLTGGLALLFWLSVTLAYCIPVRMMRGNLEESLAILQSEGDYPTSYDSGDTIDNFTVALMLSEAALSQGNPLEASLACEYNSGVGDDTIEGLSHAINGESDTSYPRYWHGYLVVLKPLLLVLNVRQIRVLFQTTLLMLAGALSAVLSKRMRLGCMASIILLGCLGIFSAATAAATLPTFFSFAVGLCGSIWIAKRPSYNRHYVGLGFFVTGALTEFFDFLDNPVVCLGMMLLVILAILVSEGLRPLRLVGLVGVAVAAWILGYGVLWGSKWVLATIVLHENVVHNALATAAVRSGQDYGSFVQPSEITVSGAITRNLEAAGWRIWVIRMATVVFVVTAISNIVAARGSGRFATAVIAPIIFLCIAAIPFVWYAVLANHSYIHAYIISYRNLVVTLMSFSIGMVALWPRARRSKRKSASDKIDVVTGA